MFRGIALAALAVASMAPAYAQDFPGLRIEANVGYDNTRAKVSYEDTAFPADNFSVDESTSGVTYGGTIGYDLPVSDGFYLGLEGSADFADNKRCEVIFGADAACFSLKRNLAAGARLGTRVGATTLFYVGGAYVNGKARISYTDQTTPANNIAASDTRNGYRLSAGLEQRIGGNFFAKAEYRYSDYANYDLTDGTQRVSLGFDRHQVVGGLGVRF